MERAARERVARGQAAAPRTPNLAAIRQRRRGFPPRGRRPHPPRRPSRAPGPREKPVGDGPNRRRVGRARRALTASLQLLRRRVNNNGGASASVPYRKPSAQENRRSQPAKRASGRQRIHAARLPERARCRSMQPRRNRRASTCFYRRAEKAQGPLRAARLARRNGASSVEEKPPRKPRRPPCARILRRTTKVEGLMPVCVVLSRSGVGLRTLRDSCCGAPGLSSTIPNALPCDSGCSKGRPPLTPTSGWRTPWRRG